MRRQAMADPMEEDFVPPQDDMAMMQQMEDMRQNPEVAKLAASYRERLYSNPTSLADVIKISMAREGNEIIGYKIQPGRDREQFQKMGFQPNDIVTSINDIQLNDPKRALDLYNVIRTAKEATFVVRRGEDELTLMVSLENGQ